MLGWSSGTLITAALTIVAAERAPSIHDRMLFTIVVALVSGCAALRIILRLPPAEPDRRIIRAGERRAVEEARGRIFERLFDWRVGSAFRIVVNLSDLGHNSPSMLRGLFLRVRSSSLV